MVGALLAVDMPDERSMLPLAVMSEEHSSNAPATSVMSSTTSSSLRSADSLRFEDDMIGTIGKATTVAASLLESFSASVSTKLITSCSVLNQQLS